MTQAKIAQLQLLQQNLQGILSQKQQLETELIEINSALVEAGKSFESYKIIGKIMVLVSKEEIIKELNEKKETINLRLKSFSKQEDIIKVNLENLQSEIFSEMKNKNG